MLFVSVVASGPPRRSTRFPWGIHVQVQLAQNSDESYSAVALDSNLWPASRLIKAIGIGEAVFGESFAGLRVPIPDFSRCS